MVGGTCGFCGVIAGVLLTAVLNVGRSWLDRRWKEKEDRAAEKRASLEKQFGPLRAYGGELDQFVHEASVIVGRFVHGAGGEAERDLAEERLEELWAKVAQLKPATFPWSLLDDAAAQACLRSLESTAEKCRDWSVECVRSGEVKAGEDFAAAADENLERMLAALEAMMEKAG